MEEIKKYDLLFYLGCIIRVVGEASTVHSLCSFTKNGIYAIGKMGTLFAKTPNPTPLIGLMDASKLYSVLRTLGGSNVIMSSNGTLICGKHKSNYPMLPDFSEHDFLNDFKPRYKLQESLLRMAIQFVAEQRTLGVLNAIHIDNGKIYACDQTTLFIGTNSDYKDILPSSIPVDTIEAARLANLTHFDIDQKKITFTLADSSVAIGSSLIAGKYPQMIAHYKKAVPDEKSLNYIRFTPDSTSVVGRASEFTESMVTIEKGLMKASGPHGKFEEEFLQSDNHPTFCIHLSKLKPILACTEKVAIQGSETHLVFGAPGIRIVLAPVKIRE